MEPETFPDPLRGAASSVLRAGFTNAMQVGYAVASASQVIAFHRKAQQRAVAERDERARRAISTQIRAERDG